jgi:hypothetical protein
VKYPKGFCCSPQLNNGQDAFNPSTILLRRINFSKLPCVNTLRCPAEFNRAGGAGICLHSSHSSLASMLSLHRYNGGRSSHLKFTPSCVSLRDALQFLSFSSPKQKRCQNFSRKNKVMGDVATIALFYSFFWHPG